MELLDVNEDSWPDLVVGGHEWEGAPTRVYLISRFGQGKHLQPSEKFGSDVGGDTISRQPTKLAEATRMVLRQAREQGRPSFHNAKCYDPQRPQHLPCARGVPRSNQRSIRPRTGMVDQGEIGLNPVPFGQGLGVPLFSSDQGKEMAGR